MSRTWIVILLVLGSALLNLKAETKEPKRTAKPQPQAEATSKSTPQQTTPASFVEAGNKNSMRITLKASRDQAAAGSNFGIIAEIENTSASPIYIIPAAIAMTVPPELDANAPHDLGAFIPGVQVPKGEDYTNTVIVLEPGAVTSAFWSGGNISGSPVTANWRAKTWQNFVNGLGFSPGRYTLSIVGSYWDTYEGAKSKSVERHTETAEIQETITAPQSVVLFGAGLGGVIAFLLLTKLQKTDTAGWSQVGWLTGTISAILLSTIVTILIARLSQNQFIISVSVNDLWGAIAVGFIITASGPSILRKLRLTGDDGSSKRGGGVPKTKAEAPATSAPHQNGGVSGHPASSGSVIANAGNELEDREAGQDMTSKENVDNKLPSVGVGSGNGQGNKSE